MYNPLIVKRLKSCLYLKENLFSLFSLYALQMKPEYPYTPGTVFALPVTPFKQVVLHQGGVQCFASLWHVVVAL